VHIIKAGEHTQIQQRRVFKNISVYFEKNWNAHFSACISVLLKVRSDVFKYTPLLYLCMCTCFYDVYDLNYYMPVLYLLKRPFTKIQYINIEANLWKVRRLGNVVMLQFLLVNKIHSLIVQHSGWPRNCTWIIGITSSLHHSSHATNHTTNIWSAQFSSLGSPESSQKPAR